VNPYELSNVALPRAPYVLKTSAPFSTREETTATSVASLVEEAPFFSPSRRRIATWCPPVRWLNRSAIGTRPGPSASVTRNARDDTTDRASR